MEIKLFNTLKRQIYLRIPDHIDLEHGYDSYLLESVIRCTAKFAKGSRFSEERQTTVEEVKLLPASIWDHIRLSLVTWQPTLNFGWITPKMVEIPVKLERMSFHYNVVPAPMSNKDRDIAIYALGGDSSLPDASDPLTWLLSEPPTETDIENAREEKYKFLSGEQAAWFMVESY